MNILAIETSCDETAVAVIRDGRHILANVISSQIALHQQYGGVVPELASREHIVNIVPVLQAALARSGLTWDQIDAIAVTRGPGLAGALLVGVNTGKALAFALDKPFVGVNHLEGHIYSNWLIPEDAAPGPPTRPPSSAAVPSPAPPPPAAPAEELPWQSRRLVGYGQAAAPPSAAAPAAPAAQPVLPVPNPQSAIRNPQSGDPQFPLIALVVSGGHSELLYMTGHGEYQMLGRTVDDAAGEAFDKVARILGLGYPGGPAVQRAAERGNPAAFDFPHSVMRGSFDFSFSGLKTAVLRKVNEFGPPLPEAPPAPPPAPVEETPAPATALPAPVAAAAPPAAATRPIPAPSGAEATGERSPGGADEQARPPVRMLGNTAATRPIAAPPPAAEDEDEDEEDEEPVSAAPSRPPAPRSAPPPATREPAATSPPPRPPVRPATGPTADTTAPPSRRATPTPEPPAPAEPERPAPSRRTTAPPSGPGLIRVESERSTAQPLPTPTPPEPIPPAPTRRAPRVLGTEGERPAGPDPELPAFLQRGTPPSRPTSIRSRLRPSEPEVPAFLRDRSSTPPADEGEDEDEELRIPRPLSPSRSVSPPPPRTPTAPPAAPPRTPSPPPTPATGTSRSAEPPARSTPTRPATPTPSAPQRRDPTAPAPPPASTRPTPRSTEPPAPPTRRPVRPADEDEEIPLRPAPRTPPPAPRTPSPAPRTPIRPVPKPQPLAEREITPIPKSVQAGRPANDEDEDIDLDDEDSPTPPRPARSSQIWSDWLEDIIDGDDEPPPPRRRPVPLEGPRRPDASVRLPGSGKPAAPAEKPPLPVADIAAAFQDAAVDILVEKTVLAVATYRARTVLMAGGVAANRPLRERLRERLGPDIDLRYPPLIFCTDNAAMIAAAAFFRYDAGLQTDWSLDIDPNARYWE